MKPKLTGLDKLSKLEREAFEIYSVWREHTFQVPLTRLDWKLLGKYEQGPWLSLARRIRRKVAKAERDGYMRGVAAENKSWNAAMKGALDSL